MLICAGWGKFFGLPFKIATPAINSVTSFLCVCFVKHLDLRELSAEWNTYFQLEKRINCVIKKNSVLYIRVSRKSLFYDF